mmetsp:Transcript_34006/g.38644  ORF Transcript_34006/g.38644 Transcript_34006/m.38644 type:complete len:168 (-) Transcript_34006:61-564(-)
MNPTTDHEDPPQSLEDLAEKLQPPKFDSTIDYHKEFYDLHLQNENLLQELSRHFDEKQDLEYQLSRHQVKKKPEVTPQDGYKCQFFECGHTLPSRGALDLHIQISHKITPDSSLKTGANSSSGHGNSKSVTITNGHKAADKLAKNPFGFNELFFRSITNTKQEPKTK